jgi:hypothetical protein
MTLCKEYVSVEILTCSFIGNHYCPESKFTVFTNYFCYSQTSCILILLHYFNIPAFNWEHNYHFLFCTIKEIQFIPPNVFTLQSINKFDIHGSVHREYIPLYVQQDATLHSLFISGNCSICFGWYLHPSSGAHTNASTASGICSTVTVTCSYSGR